MITPPYDYGLLLAWRALITAIPGAMLYVLWKMAKAALELRDNVRDIMTNHLPHIYEELKGIKEEQKLVREDKHERA